MSFFPSPGGGVHETRDESNGAGASFLVDQQWGRGLTGKIGAGRGSNASASFSMKEAFSHKSTAPAGKQT